MRSTSITAADFAPTLHCVTQLLADHCANLEIIKIGYGSELGQNVLDADIFFARGRWPKLRTLHLLNVHGTPSTSSLAASFFDTHPTIEALHMQIGAALITPNAGALPALRELRCSKDQATAILSTPSDEPRPLETLRGPFLTGRGADDALLRALDKCKTLRRVELRGISGIKVLRALAAVAPRLTWLDVAEGRPLDSGPTGTVSLATAGQWADALALFPGLTTFHGISFFSEVAFVGGGVPVLADKPVARKNDEVATALAAKCPKLRRLDHWARGTNRVVVLAREDDKVRWVVMRTREDDSHAGILPPKSKGRGKRTFC
ncbi:hypothetical protein EXIGLDRAFT_732502 [Exidia glandulosa HHB12029]|uniref:RNI-like protein n=1 Tax=Exidia glandulosa HHB12029 TaxID=1314781 RepID=A0A165KQM8_EXIGL|nr:hypothetical protein EXIGLDRAFT_732502 [Exidia glandulosa HHB12029]